MENIIVVNKQDEEIGIKPREQITKDDIYRISAVWIRNSKGQVLISQRSLNKTHDPGKWSASCLGTVGQGETYQSNAIKELHEELGIKEANLTPGPKIYNDRDWKFFCQWYFLTINTPSEEFVIQEEEVEQVKWINEEDLIREVKEGSSEYVSTMKDVIRDLYENSANSFYKKLKPGLS